MTNEKRLAEIRVRVDGSEYHSVAMLGLDYVSDVSWLLEWLLELVDELQEEMNHVLDYNLANQELVLENQRLQERVRELERHFSGEGNFSEHMPTLGDLL